MRHLLAVVLFASAVYAHGQDVTQEKAEIARDSGGCGPAAVQFDVKADKTKHAMAEQQESKATVYLLQDQKRDPKPYYFSDPTTRAGLDGQWVGANPRQIVLFLCG